MTEVHAGAIHVVLDADQHASDRADHKSDPQGCSEHPCRLVIGQLEKGKDATHEERQEGGREKPPGRKVSSAHLPQGEVNAASGRERQEQVNEGEIMNHGSSLH